MSKIITDGIKIPQGIEEVFLEVKTRDGKLIRKVESLGTKSQKETGYPIYSRKLGDKNVK